MEKLIITVEEYQAIMKRFDTLEKKLDAKTNGMKEEWIDNQQLMQLLKISRRCAQNYRDTFLPHSIIGNKLFYKMSDVEAMLENRYQKRVGR